MIRPATENDLRRIVEMSEAFYPYTSYWTESKIPFDPGYIGSVVMTLIEHGVMNVAEIDGEVVGMVGVVFIPFLFNPDYKHAGEVILWVEPAHYNSGLGAELIKSAEALSRTAGCVHIQMIDLPCSTASASRLYEGLGYKMTERLFTKVL